MNLEEVFNQKINDIVDIAYHCHKQNIRYDVIPDYQNFEYTYKFTYGDSTQTYGLNEYINYNYNKHKYCIESCWDKLETIVEHKKYK